MYGYDEGADDFNVWEENQVFLDNEGGEFDPDESDEDFEEYGEGLYWLGDGDEYSDADPGL